MKAVFKHCTKYKAFAVVSPSASYNIQRAEVKKCNKECDATLCAFRAVFLIFDGFFVVCGAVDPSLIPAHLLSNQQSADVYVIRFQRCAAGIFGEKPSLSKRKCVRRPTHLWNYKLHFSCSRGEIYSECGLLCIKPVLPNKVPVVTVAYNTIIKFIISRRMNFWVTLKYGQHLGSRL